MQETYKTGKEDYTLFQTVKGKLKQMILDAIPHEYINALRDPLLGFATTTSRTLLAHLNTTYGEITPDNLEANKELLKAPWDPNTPTETLFDQAVECQDFADQGNEPISEVQCV